ncbi:MAG: nitrous oxide reductase accessory protein NosL [Halalkalicoccus sp.]
MNGTTRRSVLVAGGALIAGAAGCLEAGDDGDEPVPEPVSLSGRECDGCGMVIGEHYGPNAQVFYEGGDPPEDRDGPAWFDSTTEALGYHEQQERRGQDKLAMYVVDYSRVDYEIHDRDAPHLSTHAEADAFVDAREATFVLGSEVLGAMEPDPIPFSDPEDAEGFADEHGGDVVGFGEL